MLLEFLEVVGIIATCCILLYSIPYIIIFFLCPIIIPIMATCVLSDVLNLDNPFQVFGLLIGLQVVQLCMWGVLGKFVDWIKSKGFDPYWENN